MAKIEKICIVCSKVFSVWPNRAESAKTCSQPCRGKIIAEAYSKKRIQKTCPICKNTFSVNPAADKKRTCCSSSCANKMPDRKRSQGADHYNWKGGITSHSDGYYYVMAEDHPFHSLKKYVFEHRLIMEKRMRENVPNHPFLCTVNGVLYLRQDINVHHLNERKKDNREINLLACTAAAHTTIHNGLIPKIGETWPDISGVT